MQSRHDRSRRQTRDRTRHWVGDRRSGAPWWDGCGRDTLRSTSAALVLAVRSTSIGVSGGVVPVRFTVHYGNKCSLSSMPSIAGWAKSFPYYD